MTEFLTEIRVAKYSTRLEFFEATVGRFWSKAGRKGPNDCWIWEGTKQQPNKCGQVYGIFGFTDREKCVSYRAHRFAWMLTNGPIPEGYVVMHNCDNPLCVNPAHLEAGTQQKNIVDMYNRGRGAVGSLHGNSKLTEDQARLAKYSDTDPNELAKQWGVDPSAIIKIRDGDNWKHL